MSPRLSPLAAMALGALALWTVACERRAGNAFSHHAEDIAELDALVTAAAALQTGVLEARAGLQLSFDPIDQAVFALRAGARDATVVRARGPAYAEAADALDRLGDEVRDIETALERVKTDLALLRLSSRYVPIAADALGRPNEEGVNGLHALRDDLKQFRDAPTPGLAWRIAAESGALDGALTEFETRARTVGALRADVERYEESPTREVARRLEVEIPALEQTWAARANVSDSAREDLDVLAGHAHAILDRRERVDRAVRGIVRSPVRADAEGAWAAYEHAARHEYALLWALRIALAGIVTAVLAFLGAAAWGPPRVRVAARRMLGADPHPRPAGVEDEPVELGSGPRKRGSEDERPAPVAVARRAAPGVSADRPWTRPPHPGYRTRS